MARSEFGAVTKRAGAFLNRHDQLRAFSLILDRALDDRGHLVVLEVIGLGGAGKTSLLREFRTRARSSGAKPVIVSVPLVAEAASTETGPLLVIRDQVRFDCLLFEAGIATYWTATGQPFRLQRDGDGVGARLLTAVETAGSASPVPLPATFARDLFHSARRRANRYLNYEPEEFDAIDELRDDPIALRRRLPHLLGRDIERRIVDKERAFIAFYDAYERQSHSTIEDQGRWLREFVGTVGRGVHVVSTREPLRWPDEDWGDVLTVVAVGALPAAEAHLRIQERIGDVDPRIEQRILDASRRLPFHLESMLSAYELEAARSEHVEPDDLPSTPDAATDRLLDHLQSTHRDLAVALAAVHVFSHPMFAFLVRDLSLQVSMLHFDELTSWFFVEELSPGLFQVHDLLTDAVLDAPRHEQTSSLALGAATRFLVDVAAHGREVGVSELLLMFHGVVSGWMSCDQVPVEAVEWIVDIGYHLYDAGYWNELESLQGSIRGSTGVATALRFLAALAWRRSGGAAAALERMDQVVDERERLGRHTRSIDIEVAYLTELTGDYDLARQQLADLDDEDAPVDPSDRISVRLRTYSADMAIMDGRFVASARMLLEIAETCAGSDPIAEAESRRHRAHCFRFSFDLDQAEAQYRRALTLAGESRALVAKLWTNLAETLCWSDGPATMEVAETAIEMNTRLGNRIEVAKAGSALAVAQATAGDLASARMSAERAIVDAQTVGYPAAELFAHQALAVIAHLDGSTADTGRHLRALLDRTDALGTYRFLAALPAWLAGDDSLFVDVAANVEWTGAESVDTRFSLLFDSR